MGESALHLANECMLAIGEHMTGMERSKAKAMSPMGNILSAEETVMQMFRLALGECLVPPSAEWLVFFSELLVPAITGRSAALFECLSQIEDGLSNKKLGTPVVSCCDVVLWSCCFALKRTGVDLKSYKLIERWIGEELEWLFICNGVTQPYLQSNLSNGNDVSEDLGWNCLEGAFRVDTKRILVTSALPYINNVPHLGNLIGSILSADVFARFARKRFTEALYICGADEYGTTTETKAIEEGCTPKEICDKYYQLHKQIYDWFEISFDIFGRTSTEQQTRIAQEIFLDLHSNGYIFPKTMEQPYCRRCKRFLSDRYVEGTCPLCGYLDARGDQCDKCGHLLNAVDLKDPKCKVCQASPENRQSEQLFLDLPKLEPKLSAWFKRSSEDGFWTSTAKTITCNWLNEGLKPRCITRDMQWGTKVPLSGFENKVFYVWFDAPIGYISITATLTPDWKEWWMQSDQVELYQFMAKDNVPFHSIVFPSSLLGTGRNYTLVNHLIGIEYLSFENEKFSKSRNVGVFCDKAVKMGIPADLWRYYLVSIRPETQDGNFIWDDFMARCNSELLNNLGNFVNRCLSFCNKNLESVVPVTSLMDAEDRELVSRVNCELEEFHSEMLRAQLREACKHVMTISKLGNQYLQSRKPWDLMKSEETRKLGFNSIGIGINAVVLLGILTELFMPGVSAEIMRQCNLSEWPVRGWPTRFVCMLPANHRINIAKPIFTRITQEFIDQLRQ